MEGTRIASVGSAMADPGRAQILCALSSGRAHTAGELARWIDLAPSTTSAHLSRLIDAGLVTVEPSGRHRYYRIASLEVAGLLERITAIDLPETNAPERPSPGSRLSYARTCYDHLAGELGVQLYRALTDQGLLVELDRTPVVTDAGMAGFGRMGIDIEGLAKQRRPVARQCLDWTQRQHHLSGALGSNLLKRMLDEGWLKPGRDKRVIAVTSKGQDALLADFGIDAQRNQ